MSKKDKMADGTPRGLCVCHSFPLQWAVFAGGGEGGGGGGQVILGRLANSFESGFEKDKKIIGRSYWPYIYAE